MYCQKCGKEHNNINNEVCNDCKDIKQDTFNNDIWYQSKWFFVLMVVIMPYVALILTFVYGHYKNNKVLRVVLVTYTKKALGGDTVWKDIDSILHFNKNLLGKPAYYVRTDDLNIQQ